MLVKFEVRKDGRWWCARGTDHDIFTQGRTLDEVYRNIKEAAGLHFEEEIERGENLELEVISRAGGRGG